MTAYPNRSSRGYSSACRYAASMLMTILAFTSGNAQIPTPPAAVVRADTAAAYRDADSLYERGRRQLARRESTRAAATLIAFHRRFPTHPQAPSAMYWSAVALSAAPGAEAAKRAITTLGTWRRTYPGAAAGQRGMDARTLEARLCASFARLPECRPMLARAEGARCDDAGSAEQLVIGVSSRLQRNDANATATLRRFVMPSSPCSPALRAELLPLVTRLDGTDAQQLLLAAADDSTRVVRSRALRLLGAAPHEWAVGRLLHEGRRGPPATGRIAVDALSQSNAPSAGPALQRLITEGSSSTVRIAAAEALVERGHPQAAVARALVSVPETGRVAIVVALGRRGDEASISSLAAVVSNVAQSRTVRLAAVHALAESSRGVAALLSLWNNPHNLPLRSTMLRVLASEGGEDGLVHLRRTALLSDDPDMRALARRLYRSEAGHEP